MNKEEAINIKLNKKYQRLNEKFKVMEIENVKLIGINVGLVLGLLCSTVISIILIICGM